jgi:Uma2 family endonuclease
MGSPAALTPISVEEYLSNPAYEHAEYIDGQIVERTMGSKLHSKVQMKCGRKLDEYFDTHPGGYVAPELHCRLTAGSRTRFYLPDVAVVLGDDAPEARFLDRAPDLAVEIRSPDDTIAYLTRKMGDYLASGAKLGWLILPEERSVLVFAPHAAPRTFVAGEILDGGELLAGLQIPVDELFV